MHRALAHALLCGFVLIACGRAEGGPCPAVPTSVSQAPGARSLDAAADDVIARWNKGDTDGLFATFDTTMQAAVPRDTLRKMMTSSRGVLGTIKSKSRTFGEASEKYGEYALDADRALLTMTIAIDDDGRISNLLIQPRKPGEASSPPPPVARSPIAMGLPVKGEWSILHVHESGANSQRRAIDLVRRGPDGSTHRGDGGANTDYYAYGEEVVAAADGTVVEAVDGVLENTPADRNNWMSAGNSIIVQHGPSLYALYGHLKTGSIHVKAGDKVTRGQTLALCGNSGNDASGRSDSKGSEPQLHFQLQDGPLLSRSWGVEPVFASVRLVRGDKTSVVQDYTPMKDDRISEAAK